MEPSTCDWCEGAGCEECGNSGTAAAGGEAPVAWKDLNPDEVDDMEAASGLCTDSVFTHLLCITSLSFS